MQADFEQFTGRKARIVVIAPHGMESVKNFWVKEKLSYIGLPDPAGKLGMLYGQEWNLLKLGRMPALFVIDRKRKFTYTQYAKHMADIPPNEEILGILDGMK